MGTVSGLQMKEEMNALNRQPNKNDIKYVENQKLLNWRRGGKLSKEISVSQKLIT